jgi:flagellar hook-basal body complex protein FliE
MIDNATSAANIQSMLRTMSALQSQASQGLTTKAIFEQDASAVNKLSNTTQGSFTDSVKQVLNQVNIAQLNASQLRESYEMGAQIPLTDVVVGMQKASIAFEATLQVRNKVLKAYEDILNMPV